MTPRQSYEPIQKPCRVRSRRARAEALLDHCEYCRRRRPAKHAHHVRSRGAGGHDDRDNLVCLCWECHGKVHDGRISREALERILRVRRLLGA